MITHTSQTLPRQVVRGMASGIFFLAFFAAFWGGISAAYMDGPLQIGAFVLVGLVTLIFFILGGMLLRSARALPKAESSESTTQGRRYGVWFGIVFGIEIMLIVLANILLSNFHAETFIAAVTALIVGVHFLPLANLFRVPAYYL